MSFWDSFFGSDQRDAIQGASGVADDEYRKALALAGGTTEDYLKKSLAYLQPDMAAGAAGTKSYMDALGINGPDAQHSFFSNYQSDPGFGATLDAGTQALDRSAASRGLLHSGGQQKSLFDFGQRAWLGNFNNRMGQLGGFVPLGSQANTNAANLTTGAGNNIAGMQFGTGQLFANNAINTGNAVAQSYGIPMTNILGSINAGANVVGAFNGSKRR